MTKKMSLVLACLFFLFSCGSSQVQITEDAANFPDGALWDSYWLLIFASGGEPRNYTQLYSNTGYGYIVGTDFDKLKAAAEKEESFVRVGFKNASTENRNGWNIGEFGGVRFEAPRPFPVGGESYVDIPVSSLDLTGSRLSVNIWSDCEYTTVDLYVKK